jgi:hypothetical protein
MAALVWTVGAPAQTLDRGSIRGTVYDKTHAAVPKAKVTLSNASTGFKREDETDSSGGYNFAQVPAGTYTLMAEAANFAQVQVKNIEINIGASISLDVTLPVKAEGQSVEVISSAGAVDTTTSGVSQLVNERNVENLPLLTQDYRDLAQLSSTAQVVPGLRGGIRLGGQQSDYSNLVIDGTSNYDNFFGEFFGSLETKNFTIPIDSVQEFQIISNGFAPEFGRATGGLINVVTKSGTNGVHGTAHYYYRGNSTTALDHFGVPSSIDQRNEVGGTIGFPIRKDKQFLFFAADIQRQHGPIVTQFCTPGPGQAVCEQTLAATTGPLIGANPDPTTNSLLPECNGAPGTSVLSNCYGVQTLADLQGSNNQFQNLFTVLGKYDYQITPNHHFSTRIYGTRNHTSGFTGGRGQNEIQASFGNTEIFNNNGANGVAALNSVFGPRKTNEVRFMLSGETRPRHANGGGPEVQINDPSIGSGLNVDIGQRFFLPINGDDFKLQALDNFEYIFGKHDMKFGGDVDVFDIRKNIFAGWSKGNYVFDTLANFNAGAALGFIQGFGANGKDIFASNLASPAFQTGMSLYWQDKWQVTPKLTLTYGLRWDATINPKPQTGTPGASVYQGFGGSTKIVAPPQGVPNDKTQFGPRVGAAYQFGSSSHVTVLRAAWGFYYAQTPTIFLPTGGNERGATLFAFFCGGAFGGGQPSGGFPYLYPDGQFPVTTCASGAQSINYVDPKFRNPRVSNFTAGVEHQLTRDVTVKFNYVYAHSARLRTGGFSSGVWSRNFVGAGTDQFGRTILAGPLDTTLGSTNSLGSYGRGNYHEYAFNVTKRYSKNFQLFANYTYSRNRDNATAERDTDTFFGPQDPFNLELDYGRNGLDISHQFKAAGVYELPWGITTSGIFIAHSGVPFPAYDTLDANGDGASNSIFNNDRPTVTAGGKSFLLGRYPANQPNFFNFDFRLLKDFGFKDRYHLQLLADFFNLTNRANLYSNPSGNAFVGDQLTSIPKRSSTGYGKIDQVAPGSSPFAFQAGVKFNF